MKFSFCIAGKEDDRDIRKMIAGSPMPGRIAVTFTREPDFFHGCAVAGHKYRVYLGRNDVNREPAILLVTADMPRYINGLEKPVGYLGSLRVADRYLGHFLPLRVMDFLRRHESGGPELYFSVVSMENITARRIFSETPRPIFPKSFRVGDIYTAGIAVGRQKKENSSGLVISSGSPEMLGDIITFLNREGSRKLLHPRYIREDFATNGVTRGFSLHDMRIAYRDGEIVGTMGYWDQSAYKQTILNSYDRPLRLLKPVYNAAANLTGSLTGLHPLPEPGDKIKSAYAAFICIKDDNPSIFKALLDNIYNLATERGRHHLLAGLSVSDPLLSALKSYRHISYRSSIYLYSLNGALPENIIEDIQNKKPVPYIEIAAL